MSSKRPAAFSRGAIAKPKSLAINRSPSLPATSINALIPARTFPERIRARPCETKIRLL